ncbi:hypothetical protein [Fluviicola sp.]|jgi:hypothetical protein|uniref:hypothetical protein n=1 Tax=Fluviicola sp. TaxID=1917219 RepID=UPI00283005AE|nr:hypothetical protein [Fluviicola sp.]MDR0803087.1 hypothetical protein [Fluviicola sp.]
MKTLLSVGFLLCAGLSFGQQASGTHLGKQVRIEREAPALTAEMEQYAVKNGSYIVDFATGEGKKVSFDGQVTPENAQKVDPKAMGIKIIDRNQFFEITGTNQMLIVKSTWVLDNEMKTRNR